MKKRYKIISKRWFYCGPIIYEASHLFQQTFLPWMKLQFPRHPNVIKCLEVFEREHVLRLLTAYEPRT